MLAVIAHCQFHTDRKAGCVYEAEGEGMILHCSECYECRFKGCDSITSHCVASVSSLCHRTVATFGDRLESKRKSTFKCDAAYTYLRITITQRFNIELFTSADSQMICFYGNTRNTERLQNT